MATCSVAPGTSCTSNANCDTSCGEECYIGDNYYDQCLIGGNQPCGGGVANTRDGTCMSGWCGGDAVCYPGLLDWWCMSQPDCNTGYECDLTGSYLCKAAPGTTCSYDSDCVPGATCSSGTCVAWPDSTYCTSGPGNGAGTCYPPGDSQWQECYVPPNAAYGQCFDAPGEGCPNNDAYCLSGTCYNGYCTCSNLWTGTRNCTTDWDCCGGYNCYAGQCYAEAQASCRWQSDCYPGQNLECCTGNGGDECLWTAGTLCENPNSSNPGCTSGTCNAEYECACGTLGALCESQADCCQDQGFECDTSAGTCKYIGGYGPCYSNADCGDGDCSGTQQCRAEDPGQACIQNGDCLSGDCVSGTCIAHGFGDSCNGNSYDCCVGAPTNCISYPFQCDMDHVCRYGMGEECYYDSDCANYDRNSGQLTDQQLLCDNSGGPGTPGLCCGMPGANCAAGGTAPYSPTGGCCYGYQPQCSGGSTGPSITAECVSNGSVEQCLIRNGSNLLCSYSCDACTAGVCQGSLDCGCSPSGGKCGGDIDCCNANGNPGCCYNGSCC